MTISLISTCDFVPEQLAYRISFWDENIDRPVAPYIAEIRLLDGKLSYFTADENQQLVLVFEESFADSMSEALSVKNSGTGPEFTK